MDKTIQRTVVIGAGTMGAAIAAHLTNAGLRVSLLDIVPEELTPAELEKGLSLESKQVRDRLARQGLEAAANSRPASFFASDLASQVEIGNLEDDFELVADADWVIEAVIENLQIKRDLMARIDEVRSPGSIVSTNTSGLPISAIAEGRSEDFRAHFLGTHFFNPPRYLKLLELIPTADTSPEVVEGFKRFAALRLGKGVVICKDTPNFIANRLGSVTGAMTLKYVLENGFTVEEVDAVTGPLIGRPKTATFRLLDLIGLDVANYVRQNLAEAIPEDEVAQRYLNAEGPNELQESMIERGWLGNKSKQGFYKQVRKNGKKAYWPLNLKTLEHEPAEKVRFESVGKARSLETAAERLEVMLSAEDRAGDLVREVVLGGLSYAARCIPEIADTPAPIDNAMRWGFNHEAGPFEVWDQLGVRETARKMNSVGHEPPAWVGEMLDAGVESFYRYEADRAVAVYHPGDQSYQPLKRSPRVIRLQPLKSAGRTVARNPGASLVDLGEGVACVEFHTKMNVLDVDTGEMLGEGLRRLETDFEGLVICNDADNFSAGANLGLILLSALSGQWDQLADIIRDLQDLHMQIRYAAKPVVVAPFGLTLGGGAEMMMHAGRVVAHAELYTGLVEVGMGLIPAGGGTKEMVRRLLGPPMRTENVTVLPFIQRLFEQVGQAKVATSAEEARQFGMLGPQDRVVMNRDHLLAEARREVLHMCEGVYRPPQPEPVYAAGRDALAALRLAIHTFREGGYITEYEAHIGEKLATVMTGGDLSRPSWVSEQYFLDLEREAFLSLCGEAKTQERISHFLETNKPLRN